VLTVLWHDRSHAPERFWGDFYSRLVEELKSLDGWFATGGQVAAWFRKRRQVRFDLIEATDDCARIGLRYEGGEIRPPLSIRIHRPCARRTNGDSPRGTTSERVDTPWTGKTAIALDPLQPSWIADGIEEGPGVWHQKGQATCSLR